MNGDALNFALNGLEAKEIMHIIQEDNTSAQVILNTPLDREVNYKCAISFTCYLFEGFWVFKLLDEILSITQ